MNAIQEYQSYIAKVDVTPTIDITSLSTLAERAKKIVVNDITNEAEMAVAKAMRKELSDARIEISKNAKVAREDFHKAWKGVIEVEKILLSEFTDEEDRLKKYETDLKAKKLRDERMLVLPIRKERLFEIKVLVTDEELLAMDDLTFSNFLATKQAEILAEQKRKDEEEARLEQAREEAKREAEEEAKRQAEAKEREHQAELDRIEAEAKAKAEAEERAKREAEEEADRLAKEQKYQQFLTNNDYNEEEFITKDEGDKVVLYKKVAVYVKG